MADPSQSLDEITWESFDPNGMEVMQWAELYRFQERTQYSDGNTMTKPLDYRHILAGLLQVREPNSDLAQLIIHYHSELETDTDSLWRRFDLNRLPSLEFDPDEVKSRRQSFSEEIDGETLDILNYAKEIAEELDSQQISETDIFSGMLRDPKSEVFQTIQKILADDMDLRDLDHVMTESRRSSENGEFSFPELMARSFPRAAKADNDKPVVDSKGDELNLYARAAALARLAMATSPPFAFGIYGQWGTGKSSFMSMIKSVLEHRSPRPVIQRSRMLRVWQSIKRGGRSQRTNEPEIIPIEFNPWKHNDSETLWPRLMEQIYDEMSKRPMVLTRPWRYFRFVFGRRWRQFPLLLRAKAMTSMFTILIGQLIGLSWNRWNIESSSSSNLDTLLTSYLFSRSPIPLGVMIESGVWRG